MIEFINSVKFEEIFAIKQEKLRVATKLSNNFKKKRFTKKLFNYRANFNFVSMEEQQRNINQKYDNDISFTQKDKKTEELKIEQHQEQLQNETQQKPSTSSGFTNSNPFSSYRDVDVESVFSKKTENKDNNDDDDYDDYDNDEDGVEIRNQENYKNNNLNQIKKFIGNEAFNDNSNQMENWSNQEDQLDDITVENEAESSLLIEQNNAEQNQESVIGNNLNTQPHQLTFSSIDKNRSIYLSVINQINEANTSTNLDSEESIVGENPLTTDDQNNQPVSLQSTSMLNSSSSRLGRTVRSYLNSLNAIAESTGNRSSLISNNTNNISNSINTSQIDLYLIPKANENLNENKIGLNQENSTFKFEPKSFEFNKLLTEAQKQPQISNYKNDSSKNIKNCSKLIKLAELFLNYENYHSTMLISDKYFFDDFNLIDDSNSKSIVTNHFEYLNKQGKCSSLEKSSKRMRATINTSNQLATNNKRLQSDFYHQTCKNGTVNQHISFKPTGDKNNENNFFLCKLCMHCLYEPITLICGCSYCKNCLKEYNLAEIRLFNINDDISLKNNNNSSEIDNYLTQNSIDTSSSARADTQIFLTNRSEAKRKHDSNQLDLYRCINCGKAHQQNTAEQLKQNVCLSNLVDKFWLKNIEIRKLRNDIRNYICFKIESCNQDFLTELKMYEYMLRKCYYLDQSNHLILADLFLLNYFTLTDEKNNQSGNCLSYAEMATELKPDWPFGFFMKSIFYQKFGKLSLAKENLIICLQLDANLHIIRSRIYELSYETPNKIEKQIMKNISEPRVFAQNDYSNVSNKIVEELSALKHKDETNNSFLGQKNNKQISLLNFDSDKYISIDSLLAKPTDFECSLCYRLFYKPVTTPCGHTFCCSCLERSLDHQDRCPLCKYSLADYLAERRQHVTNFIDNLIKIHYKTEYMERIKQHNDELKEISSNENEVPIFVCTLALPFAPCPLHMYEPRYRLMIRRAIETSSKQFGMCMHSERSPYHYTEYGCMLEIQNYQFTRDGRVVVATTGGRRYRVLESRIKDGYNVAKVEWVKDVRIYNEQEIVRLQMLHDEVYRLAHNWYSLIPEVKKNTIFDMFGIRELPPPEANVQSDNGPFWHWFLLNVLPLEQEIQYKFLAKTSLRDRLQSIKRIILILMTPFERLKQTKNMLQSNTSIETSQSNQNLPSSSITTSEVSNISLTSYSNSLGNSSPSTLTPSTNSAEQSTQLNLSPSNTETSINLFVQNLDSILPAVNSENDSENVNSC